MLTSTADQGALAQTGAEKRGKKKIVIDESNISELLALLKEMKEEMREIDEQIREELRWRDNHLEDQIKKRENTQAATV